MDRRALAIAALVALALLGGCSSYLSDAGGEPSDGLSTISSPSGGTTTPTAADDTTDGTPAETDSAATPTESTPTDGTDTPADRPWSPPAEPNKPLEKALNGSQGNRIESLKQHDASPGNATGDVELTVTANTSMSNVDPADMGTVRGEPFYLAYVNGSLHPGGEWSGSQFYRVEGTLAANTGQVVQRDDATYRLTVPAGAFEAADAEGEVEVLVMLLDQDKQWDDVYGVANVTVDYELPPDGGNETATENESTATDDDGTITEEPTGTESAGTPGEEDDAMSSDDTPTAEGEQTTAEEPTSTETDSFFDD